MPRRYGHSLALHCAGLGLRVLATCLGQGEGRARLKEEEGVTVLSLDLTCPDSRRALVAEVQALLADGGLHCLVNNAAVLVFAEAAWQTDEQAELQVKVNMLGPQFLTRALLPQLARAGGGRVVNLISNCTTVPLPTLALYTASKAGLLALSEAQRPELAKYGVGLVIVNPGDAPFTTSLTGGQATHYEGWAPALVSSPHQDG
jgi:NAD(P)-dependent dehydrogenase (short-subunit alcohol dehydrogenase family)